MTYRDASDYIQREFMLRLKDAPFDTKCAELNGVKCAECPKRTGNQKELFADVESADICTDPKCYAGKKEAWAARLIARAEAKGQMVLRGAEKIFTPYGGIANPKEWVDLEREVWTDEGSKPLSKLLGKRAPKPILVVDAQCIVRKLAPAPEVKRLLVELGIEKPEPEAGTNSEEDERSNRRDLMLEVVKTCAPDMISALISPSNEDILWRYLASSVCQRSGTEHTTFVAKRRGWAKKQQDVPDAIEQWIADKERTTADFKGFVAELMLVTNHAIATWNQKLNKEWTDLCDALCVDYAGVEETLTETKSK